MIEPVSTLRAIQSSFMVYKWTMAMQFSFEYCIDPKDHKSEVQGNCSWRCHLAKALTGCQGLAGSALHDVGVPSEHWNNAALFVIMPAHYLIMENMWLETNTIQIWIKLITIQLPKLKDLVFNLDFFKGWHPCDMKALSTNRAATFQCSGGTPPSCIASRHQIFSYEQNT